MHPDMIREIAAQQVAGQQAAARAHQQAKLARQARRAQRRANRAPDPLADVRVPDFVDGTYRDTEPVLDGERANGTAPQGRRHAPAGHKAA